MKKVYYLILKAENRLVKKLIVKDGRIYEFYIGQDKSKHELVNQHLNLSDSAWHIDTKNNLLDEMMKIISNTINLPQIKDSYLLVESTNQVGKYYNRIYRPIIEEPSPEYTRWGFRPMDYAIKEVQKKVFAKKAYFPFDELGLLSGLNQLSLLTNLLHNIFQTIHPDKSSLEVYGHSIRNLLILACTEVETQLKGILLSNGYPKVGSLSTKDYVILKDVLALENYSIKLNYYPLLDELKPFNKWDVEKSTESLSWYFNYNATKHDRENNIKNGSIIHVLNAIAAVALLIRAQYGEQDEYWKEHIGGFFRFTEVPVWAIEEKYIPPLIKEDWKQICYFK